MTSGVTALAVWLHLPFLHYSLEKSFKDMADAPVHIPGVPLKPASDIPVSVHDRESDTAGAFTPEQIKKIAVGLERNRQRFLWVVCSRDDAKNIFKPRSEPDLNSLLPKGFLNRTKDQGMVVKSWTPQIEVLNHELVGGFISHCGWNSTLESMLAGVPMICWPLYAEKAINKVLLVEEMKVGVVMEGYNKELVHAEEVEAKVRYLMESEGGRMVRERMAAFKEKAIAALAEDRPLDGELKAFLRNLRSSKES